MGKDMEEDAADVLAADAIVLVVVASNSLT